MAMITKCNSQWLWAAVLLICATVSAAPSAEYFTHFHDRITWETPVPEQGRPVAAQVVASPVDWRAPRRIWLVCAAGALAAAVALQLLAHIVREASALRLRWRLASAVRDGDGPRFRQILLDAHRAPPGADAQEFADSLPEEQRDFLKQSERKQFFSNT